MKVESVYFEAVDNTEFPDGVCTHEARQLVYPLTSVTGMAINLMKHYYYL